MQGEEIKITEFIRASIHITSNEDNERVSAFHKELVSDIDNIFVLSEIAKNGADDVKSGAVLYFNQIVERAIDEWKDLGQKVRNKCKECVVDLCAAQIPMDSITGVIQTLVRLLGLEENMWSTVPTLFEHYLCSGDNIHAFMLICQSKSMPKELLREMEPHIVEAALPILAEQSTEAAEYAAVAITSIILYLDSELPEHVAAIVEMACNIPKLAVGAFHLFWESAIGELCSTELISTEKVAAIANAAIEHAKSADLDINLRLPPLSAVVPALITLGEDISTLIFSSELLVRSEDALDALPEGELFDTFDAAFRLHPHKVIFPSMQRAITSAIASENLSLQAIALLAFQTVFSAAPDSANLYLDEIMEFTASALQSDALALISAALGVVKNTFDSSAASIQQHSISILELCLPHCTSSDEHIRKKAAYAAQSILEQVDCKVPGLFQSVMDIGQTVLQDNDDEEWVNFLSFVPYAISQSEELDDEQIDSVLELMENVINCADDHKEPNNILQWLLPIATATIICDDTQTETVLQILGNIPSRILSEENVLIQQTAIHFYRDLAKTLKDEAAPLIAEYANVMYEGYDEIIEFGDDHIKNSSIEALAIICRYVTPLRNDIIKFAQSLPSIIDNNIDDVLQAALLATRKLATIIDDYLLKRIFDVVYEIVAESPNTDAQDTGDCVKTLRKILKVGGSSVNGEHYKESIGNIIKMVIDGTLPIFGGSEFIRFPEFHELAKPILLLMGQYVTYPEAPVDEITKFVLSWFEHSDDDDVSLEYAVDFIIIYLDDAITNPNLSDEVASLVFEAVHGIIELCQDPSSRQNLVFFFTTIIRNDPSQAESILEYLPHIQEWYDSGKEIVYGYSDTLANIAALYLEIASVFPDFPDEFIIQALSEFPPSDTEEISPMSRKIIEIVERNAKPNVILQSALAIARYFVLDDVMRTKYEIDEQTVAELSSILNRIVKQNPNINTTLRKAYSKQRSKYRRIEAILK